MNKFTNRKLWIPILASLLTAFYTSSVLAKNALETGEARCKQNLEYSGGCEVEYVSPDVENPFNHVEQFNKAVGKWTNYREDMHEVSNSSLEAGNLYRVSACKTRDDDCKKTSVFWAPIFTKDAEEIPSSYAIADGEGGSVLASISKNAPLVDQLRQLNVYMITDLVTRFKGREMGRMLKPKDHAHYGLSPSESDHSHDEHFIHYDVYHNYTNLVKNYKEKRKQTEKD